MSASTITAPKKRTTRKATPRASSSRNGANHVGDTGDRVSSKAGRIRLRGPRRQAGS